MCPSYMVTREEMHSTRGRAHLLFEMLQGDPMNGGWKNEHVKEALDLCLACKGCKSECPMNVDMATYKAEFLVALLRGAAPPRHAYAMGLIYWWARLASLAPGLVNLITQSPVVGAALPSVSAAISPQRRMPSFAARDVQALVAPPGAAKRRRAAGAALARHVQQPLPPRDGARRPSRCWRRPGSRSSSPRKSLCCGRPLYDFGMLDTAKRLLREILDALRPEIEAGTPVVGLEPSCVAVFRDEMMNLFPRDGTPSGCGRRRSSSASS